MKSVAVIGAGGMGQFHAEMLQALPGVELAAIADPYPSAAATALGVPVLTDPLACAAQGWDGVVIASPDDTHAELTLAALAAGSRVLCEKPLSHDIAGAQAVVDLEVAQGLRRVQVGFMREYDQPHRGLQQQLAGLGDLHYLRCTHRNSNTVARPPTTVLVQSVIHDIHTIRWLGGEIVEVDARSIPRPGGLLHVLLVLKLDSGATASVEFSDDVPAYCVQVEATTVDGIVSSEGSCEPAPSPQTQLVERTERHDWFAWFTQAYRSQDEEWVESLSAPSASGPSAWDGIAAQLVSDAAGVSLATHKPVAVAMPERPALYCDRRSS